MFIIDNSIHYTLYQMIFNENISDNWEIFFEQTLYNFSIVYLMIFLISYKVIYLYLYVKTTNYIANNDNLKISHGVLNREVDQIDLQNIMDIEVVQPFIMRLFGKQHIVFIVNDFSGDSDYLESKIFNLFGTRSHLYKRVEVTTENMEHAATGLKFFFGLDKKESDKLLDFINTKRQEKLATMAGTSIGG